MYDTSRPWRDIRFDRWYHLVMVGLILNAVLDLFAYGEIFGMLLACYATLQVQRGVAAIWFGEGREHRIVSLFRIRYGALAFVVGLVHFFTHVGYI